MGFLFIQHLKAFPSFFLLTGLLTETWVLFSGSFLQSSAFSSLRMTSEWGSSPALAFLGLLVFWEGNGDVCVSCHLPCVPCVFSCVSLCHICHFHSVYHMGHFLYICQEQHFKDLMSFLSCVLYHTCHSFGMCCFIMCVTVNICSSFLFLGRGFLKFLGSPK